MTVMENDEALVLVILAVKGLIMIGGLSSTKKKDICLLHTVLPTTPTVAGVKISFEDNPD